MVHQVQWGVVQPVAEALAKQYVVLYNKEKQRETKTLGKFNSLLYTMAVVLGPCLCSTNANYKKGDIYTKKLQFSDFSESLRKQINYKNSSSKKKKKQAS